MPSEGPDCRMPEGNHASMVEVLHLQVGITSERGPSRYGTERIQENPHARISVADRGISAELGYRATLDRRRIVGMLAVRIVYGERNFPWPRRGSRNRHCK